MHSSRRTIVVAGIAAAVVALPSAAWAGFSGVGKTSATVSTATLAAPTSLATTKSCTFLGIGGDYITVNWAASTTTATTGYTVVFDTGGSGTDITKSVSGRNTTSTTVAVRAGSTYSITVSSVLQNWTTSSTAVSAGCGLFG